MAAGEENPEAKPLSVRQLELAELWVLRLKAGETRMPEWMRREFFSLFWEEQCERAAEGRAFRLPTGSDAQDRFLMSEL